MSIEIREKALQVQAFPIYIDSSRKVNCCSPSAVFFRLHPGFPLSPTTSSGFLQRFGLY